MSRPNNPLAGPRYPPQIWGALPIAALASLDPCHHLQACCSGPSCAAAPGPGATLLAIPKILALSVCLFV